MIRKIILMYWVVRVLLASEVRSETIRLISLMSLAVSAALWLLATVMGVIFDVSGAFAEVTGVGMWASAVVYCVEA